VTDSVVKKMNGKAAGERKEDRKQLSDATHKVLFFTLWNFPWGGVHSKKLRK
jgi:hypothetical protein